MTQTLHASKMLVVTVLVLTVIAATVSPTPLVVVLAGAVLILGLCLLWPVKDAPILLLPFGLQWLQAAVKPMETALLGKPLDDLSDFGGGLTTSAYFALGAVAALAIGMRLGLGADKSNWRLALERDAKRWSGSSILRIALGLIILGHALDVASNFSQSTRQILGACAELRQSGLFLLAYWCIVNEAEYAILALVVATEVAFGMTGFFAGFRETVLVLLIAMAAAKPRLGPSSAIGGSVVITLILVVAVFWTSIKVDYREFLNQGTQQQVVTQPFNKRVDYIVNAVENFDREKAMSGVAKLAARISYIDFLARTLDTVPARVPHQGGAQLGGAFMHIITPRILFPDKPETPNDTVVTAKYTGINLNYLVGTSISIGYVGEIYVDFGYWAGILGALALGYFAGRAYALVRSFNGLPYLANYALTMIVIFPFSMFEIDLIRLVGSSVTVFLATIVLQRFVAPMALPSILHEQSPVKA